MQAPKRPPNEAERLEALASYQILDSEFEAAFDDIAKLAAYICDTPIAGISLVSDQRQWFKSVIGADVRESARDIAFCAHVVGEGRALLVPDTQADQRFAENPFVTGDVNLRFYAGQPLIDEDGFTLGSLCVMDHKPRQLTSPQIVALDSLARQVVAQMKLRREVLAQRELSEALHESQVLLKQFFSRDDVLMGLLQYKGDTIDVLYSNPRLVDYFDRVGIDGYEVDRKTPIANISLWFDAVARCAESRETQIFIGDSAGLTITPQATISFVGLSKEGYPRLAFSVEDVTKQLADEKMLDDQRQVMVNTSKLSSLGEMAAGMAHEINNPLAIIAGRAQELRMLIARDPINPEQLVSPIQSIEKTVARISKIIKGLRSFARESSRDPLEPTRIGDVLQETLAFCNARFHAHGVQLEVRNVVPDAQVNCRPAEMSQVFLNLLNNAFDAIKPLEAPRWVRVDVGPREDAIEIAIVDSGFGIAESLRDKIMVPFFTTKAVNHGTGLGLSITKGIVESHGGDFFLDEACPNTRFVIRLPQHAAAKSALRPTSDKQPSLV